MTATARNSQLDQIIDDCRALSRKVRDYDVRITSITERGAYARIRPLLAALEDAIVRYAEKRARAGARDGTARTSPVALAFQDVLTRAAATRPAVPVNPAVKREPGVAVTFPPSDFSPAEILQFLALNQKTGEARIRTPNETFYIQLSNGEITSAVGTATPKGLRLGDILVDRKVISGPDLESVVDGCRREKVRLGRALVDRQFADRDDVMDALHHQAFQLFRRMLGLEVVEMTFQTCDVPVESDSLQLCVAQALLEGVAAGDRDHRVD